MALAKVGPIVAAPVRICTRASIKPGVHAKPISLSWAVFGRKCDQANLVRLPRLVPIHNRAGKFDFGRV